MLDFGAFSIIAQDVFMHKRESTIYNKNYRDLIDLLVTVRKEKNITQNTLANKIGISRRNISKIETHTRRLDIIELNDWLKALGIKIDIIENIKNSV